MSDAAITPSQIEALFTRSDDSFVFARWGRPIVPVVFGVDDKTLGVVKGAVEAVVFLAGHKMAETDTELGANLMVFFFRDWSELADVPKLDQLIPGFGPLVERLTQTGADQYRAFRFDANGTIKAAFVFVRMNSPLADMSAETLALGQMAQVILLWSDAAFQNRSPLARVDERVVLHSHRQETWRQKP